MATSAKAQRNGHTASPPASPPASPSAVPAPPTRDEFDSEAFEERRDFLPYLQMLNASSADQSGFFIAADNADAVGFTPNEDWLYHETIFRSGARVEGYRSLTARFLILRRSKLLMFEREGGQFVAPYRKELYDRQSMILKNRYLVYLVSKDKQLLHQSPLVFTAKGSFCGSLGETVEQFRLEMSQAYGAAVGAKKPRGDRFMALSVLALRVQPELKGTTQKSWVCSVAEHCIPTVENWQSLFVGYQTELKDKILADIEEWADFGNLEREQGDRTESPSNWEQPTSFKVINNDELDF
ncbi:MAG: DUF5895 domain-containing protein [Oculatellaceae cyanobacterium Prado106]|jgi:hypothetical protein|nr:DUF5895 domain-containing protein [Oculatellaceae cyanobacterium Prado106]